MNRFMVNGRAYHEESLLIQGWHIWALISGDRSHTLVDMDNNIVHDGDFVSIVNTPDFFTLPDVSARCSDCYWPRAKK